MTGRRLGQHFLKDANIIAKIIDQASLSPEDNVLEIGPGRGALTKELVKKARQVVAVELDAELAEALPSYPNLTVIRKDILRTDLKEILSAETPGRKWKVIANLPYYITTPIIEKLLLEGQGLIECMVIMIQKEVAVRIKTLASRDTGALSYFVRYHANAEMLFTVKAGSFSPPPKVDSAIIRLTPWEPPVEADKELLFQIIRTAFGERRKTLKKSLGKLFDAEAALKQAAIDPTRRPETLTLEEFAAIARASANMPETDSTSL
ncbi:MAG: 16S rRNA (adenine(1518)-N(6)/adenine(1519)-N(6))-dimethyltransferase RsmA [bacterium]|nr:16S rRNA (adenine(1518)-N(6)/adenine(1519)-N(6))-dimethyltransferase RsmA [bacterium]